MNTSKDFCKITIKWQLTKPNANKNGILHINYNNYPLDEEIFNMLIKKFENGELTGYKIKPTYKELKVEIKRSYYENGKEIKIDSYDNF